MNIILHTINVEQPRQDVNALLSDLGKPTRRGLKKCPKCGFLNGTRGFMCKNSLCNLTLKDSDKRKVYLDSIKLYTGTSRQIYSVRVRDKGPEHRGFVQLSLYEKDEKKLFSEVALCFVDSCQRLFDDSILKCHENDSGTTTICAHIKSALKSYSTAVGLEFKHELISNLRVNDDVRKKLCLLAKSCDGPVVQRVSKNVFAVKCAVTPTNPLGYLHLFLKGSSDHVDKFYCNCTENQVLRLSDRNITKCLHYYACICAFVSTPKFAQKYASIIKYEFDTLTLNYDYGGIHNNNDAKSLQRAKSNNQSEALSPATTTTTTTTAILCTTSTCNSKQQQVISKVVDRQHRDDYDYVDVMSFKQWLPSVTERINAALNVEGCELIRFAFHINNRFYELLKERIYYRNDCKEITSLYTRDRSPYGTYTKHTWTIKNLETLREILRADGVALKERKIYCQLNDNYTECLWLNCCNKTHMLVALNVTPLHAFVLEWTANLYPITGFGELRVTLNCVRKLIKA